MEDALMDETRKHLPLENRLHCSKDLKDSKQHLQQISRSWHVRKKMEQCMTNQGNTIVYVYMYTDTLLVGNGRMGCLLLSWVFWHFEGP